MASTGTDKEILAVDGLTVEFRAALTTTTAIKDISLRISAGEIVGLLGQSGSGKTTLGSALLGLLPVEGRITGGSIRFHGQELVGLSERELQKIRGAAISTISQEPRIALNPVIRAGVQVVEVVRAHQPWSASKCREAALAVLKEVRLDPATIFDAYPHELSGGQCQRVAIAQALVCNPQLVIADEPTSSLDSTVQLDILELLSSLRERLKISFLLITHNPAILANYADRVLVMHEGRIVESGEARSVFERPSHPYTQMLLGSRKRMLETSGRA